MMISNEGKEGPAIQLTAHLGAPRERVFAAWTHPELVREWFFAEEGFEVSEATIDLQPLGAYGIVVEVAGSSPTRIHGNYLEIVANESLSFTWTGACAGEQYWTLVRVRFEQSSAGGTNLKLTHGVFQNDRDRAMHEQGWLSCLEGLDRFLALPEC